MELEKWMKLNKITQKKMAEDIGVFPSQIHSIITGKWQPKPKLAKKIRDYTQQQVTLEDIYNILTREELEQQRLEEKKMFNPEIAYEEIAKIVLEKLTKLIEDKYQTQEVK